MTKNSSTLPFPTFLREVKADFGKLLTTYPPGPTVNDLTDYYGETRYRCERVIQEMEKMGLVARVAGPARKIYVVLKADAALRFSPQNRLTIYQTKILDFLTNFAREHSTKLIETTYSRLSQICGSSLGNAISAITRMQKLDYIHVSSPYFKDGASRILVELKIDY